MARRVICKNCTNELTTDIAFKVTDEKGKNSYYCSKEEYEQMCHNALAASMSFDYKSHALKYIEIIEKQ